MTSHHNIKILTWFNFFSDFQPFAPVLILYFANVTGSYVNSLGLFSLIAITTALAEVPTGVFSDHIGRRKTVIIGAICMATAFILYATGKPFALILGSILSGIAEAFYSGNNDALLHDTLAESKEEEHYAHHLGKITAMFQLSLGLSAILGSLIANKSFTYLMWLSVIPQIICIILATRLAEPKNITKNPDTKILANLKIALKQFWTNEKLRLLSSANILETAVGETAYRFQAAFFTALLPVWAIGFVRASINIVSFIGFHFSGKITKKFGVLKSALYSNASIRAINLLAYGVPSFISPILIALSSLPFSVGSVAKNALFQKEFKPEVRATMGSFNSLAGSIMFAIVGYFLGLVADQYSPAKAMFLFQLLLIPTSLVYFMINKRENSIKLVEDIENH